MKRNLRNNLNSKQHQHHIASLQTFSICTLPLLHSPSLSSRLVRVIPRPPFTPLDHHLSHLLALMMRSFSIIRGRSLDPSKDPRTSPKLKSMASAWDLVFRRVIIIPLSETTPRFVLLFIVFYLCKANQCFIQSAPVSIEKPTKAELRALRVGALRRLGIFLDENPRPDASSTTTATATTTTTNFSQITPNTSSISYSSSPPPKHSPTSSHSSDYARIHNRLLPIPPSSPLIPIRRPSPTQFLAPYLAVGEDDEPACPTHFTHSPIPVYHPTAPPSTPAFDSSSSDASPFPIDDRDDIVEVLGSPYPEINFHPFSPRDERDEAELFLPANLLVSPEVVTTSGYFARDTIYETCS